MGKPDENRGTRLTICISITARKKLRRYQSADALVHKSHAGSASRIISNLIEDNL